MYDSEYYSAILSSIDSMAVATVRATATNGGISDYQTVQIYMTK